MTEYKLTFKYVLTCFIAVILTFVLHEFSHWFAGHLLGHKMTMTLNRTFSTDGQAVKAQHDTIIVAAGPIFTLIQAFFVFFLLRRHNNIFLYPFLFVPFFMRILAGLTNFINLNDEGKISTQYGLGTFTLSLIICVILFLFIYEISKKYSYPAKLQTATTLLTIFFTLILIISDQSLHIRLIN